MDLKDKNQINIIGLNYKDESGNAKNFLKKYGNPYSLIGVDKKGEVAIQLGAYGVPETYVLKKGKIILKHIGPLNEDTVSKILELKKK
jgi:cytochrome c biogenesis protein CcmG/thiol:disulfide interchange protein DsbE